MPRGTRSVLLATAAVLSAGCATQWEPPTISPPLPGYVSTEAAAPVVWDAAVDFLVDTGTEWEFISDDLRTARMTSLITRGPLRRGADRRANRDAERFADCGVRQGGPGAGWGDLMAAVAIRVREAADGSGLLKVVVPSMWLQRTDYGPLSCVSTGELEQTILEGIRDRVRPVMREGGAER